VGGLSASDALVASLLAVLVIVVTMDTQARGPLFYIGAVLQMLAWLMVLVVPVDAMTLVIAFVVYAFANTLAGSRTTRCGLRKVSPRDCGVRLSG
jgi:hypothetical protein